MSLTKIQTEFSYSPDTGEILRLTRKNSNGSIDAGGYLIIKFKGKQYKSHRIAWFLHYGYMPNVIDHINGNKLDNRIVNLRDVSIAINNRNTKARGISIDTKTKGLKAVYRVHRCKGKTNNFRTLKEALVFRRSLDLEKNIIRRVK